MTVLEKSIDSLIDVFHKYSLVAGHYHSISKGDLKNLMEKELTTFLKSQKDPLTVDTLFKELDSNKDQQINFEEFMVLVTRVGVACHEEIHKE
ncbi:protein S100-A8-like [Ornithorhynchus anatinus]|uniref:Protein S100 n=1 Tax=Ornithorhynchus anatinus TaxID=9258 RepID=F7FV87_ORNAN|nr:protein S100-A8-like [Ornithorhynchus anatinus]